MLTAGYDKRVAVYDNKHTEEQPQNRYQYTRRIYVIPGSLQAESNTNLNVVYVYTWDVDAVQRQAVASYACTP